MTKKKRRFKNNVRMELSKRQVTAKD